MIPSKFKVEVPRVEGRQYAGERDKSKSASKHVARFHALREENYVGGAGSNYFCHGTDMIVALSRSLRMISLNMDKSIEHGSVSVPPVRDNNNDGTSGEQISAAEKSFLQKVTRTKLVKTTNDIKVQRKNSNFEVYNVKTFDALRLKPYLLKGINAMGYKSPSKLQRTVLPTLLANPPQNMIVLSQSGTGKTTAFVMAMLRRVDPSLDYPQVLCLTSTYELAIHIGEVVAKMSRFCTKIKIKYALKGVKIRPGSKITEHIIIGTSGKVLNWGHFNFFNLRKISVCVLDKADVMIATQDYHRGQCIRIRKLLSHSCQIMFSSATYEPEVMSFAERMVNDSLIIRLPKEEKRLDNITQYYIECKDIDAKYKAVVNTSSVIVIGQAIIYCHTKKTAFWLTEKLMKGEHAVAILSSDLTMEQKISALDRFSMGLVRVLVTTDILARGIDIEEDSSMVVNFDLPINQQRQADYETYLQRIGRTERNKNSRIVLNLIDSPHAMWLCKDIEKHFGKKIHDLDAEDVDLIEKIGT